jgi:hypothetical protein
METSVNDVSPEYGSSLPSPIIEKQQIESKFLFF